MEEQELQKLKIAFGDLVEIVYKNRFADQAKIAWGYFKGYEKGIVKLAPEALSKVDLLKELYLSENSDEEDISFVTSRHQINFMPYFIKEIIEIRKYPCYFT